MTPLDEYKRKRDFTKTAEPAGQVARAAPSRLSRFVVQKHSASRLHYDFRLELDGVLPSWAVPKGPSMDPADKRLAVHVEDHPVEYFDFEGTIPKGEYGGGTVMVWDWGGVRWLGDDPQAMLEKGDLKFELYGRKLKGAYAVVRSSRSDGKDWLLIKKRDDAARPGEDITAMDRSVLSGRSMEEIAAGEGRVWHSKDSGRGASGSSDIDLSKAKAASFPNQMEPMLATAEKKPFDDPKWCYELKLDGFRTMAHIHDGKARLRTRRGLDASKQYPELQSLLTLVRVKDAVLDGEVVALDEEGLPSFSRLQERTGWKGGRGGTEPHPSIPIVYYVFDLLYWEGFSLLDVPLQTRRRLLAATLLDGPSVRLLETFDGDVGTTLFRLVKDQGQEGVVAKRLDARYQPGRRTKSWLKIKAAREQACVVVGCTPPAGGRKYFGSLSLGVYENGKLRYAGQVGSGFDESLLAGTHRELKALEVKRPAAPLDAKAAPEGTMWVKPRLVCEVKYTEWTREGLLRQATFLRMRTDLTPEDCVKED